MVNIDLINVISTQRLRLLPASSLDYDACHRPEADLRPQPPSAMKSVLTGGAGLDELATLVGLPYVTHDTTCTASTA